MLNDMGIIEKKCGVLIATYNKLVQGIDDQAAMSHDRAYGGIVRAGKGKLVESIAAYLVQIAWENALLQRPSRLDINKKKMPIGIRENYIDRISNLAVKKYVEQNKDKLIYKFGTDVQVFIDGRLVLPIECKAYTENAMLKRILFDAALMKEAVGTTTYYLIQLESQLGGDYCDLKEPTFGSPATHALLSHVDVDLKIITLLKGERNIDRPIHKAEYYKPLEMSELLKAVDLFANDLRKYAR